MRVCGIVAEYNPFHLGHKYHINETRKAGATHIIAVMSGSFVQRAEPAILDKFQRAEVAADCGADLVIELPVQYAVASSERFARGAVEILNSLGVVNMLSFGSENGDISELKRTAEAVSNTRVAERTKQFYEQGENYPKARQAAVCEIYGNEIAKILAKPNNLLGVDYIKALGAVGAKIEPFTVCRKGAEHDGTTAEDGIASASHIRKLASQSAETTRYLPEESALKLENAFKNGSISGGMQAIERVVLYKLRSMPRESFAALPDCADGLGNRLFAAAAEAQNIKGLYAATKTKRYTMSRVRRSVVCAMLDIDSNFYFPAPYARVLAIGKGGQELLTEISKKAAVPVSHSVKTLLKLGGDAEKTMCAEIRATDLYNLTMRGVVATGHDFTEKLYVTD